MPRKEIQRERIRRYFLDAARNIILQEGIEAVTTKKIADQAAYSYASIYNYFENLNELVCLAVEELAMECASWVQERMSADASSQNVEAGGESALEARIVRFAMLMVEYHAANPKIYAPFLSTSIDFGYFIRRDGHHFMHPAYGLLLDELQRAAHLPEHERRILADILVYIFHSKMHFYLRYGTPSNLAALEREIEEEVRFVLSRSAGAAS
ncbi:MAG: TetR/AcrR family transcriptional regulator [Spirochaetaceae bacterium]|nr:TetR/AcrR family transcriptional regulator [Spirochaetaceae bacterium]